MLLTVAYGVYAFFFESSPQETVVSATKELENLNAFITKVAEASKVGLSQKDGYIIQRAETKWKQDPLITAELMKTPEKEEEEPKEIQVVIAQPNISYTGYLQMGEKRFAIINGLEYERGDELDQGGFAVKSISPNQVVIVTTDGQKRKFIFPLEE